MAALGLLLYVQLHSPHLLAGCNPSGFVSVLAVRTACDTPDLANDCLADQLADLLTDCHRTYVRGQR